MQVSCTPVAADQRSSGPGVAAPSLRGQALVGARAVRILSLPCQEARTPPRTCCCMRHGKPSLTSSLNTCNMKPQPAPCSFESSRSRSSKSSWSSCSWPRCPARWRSCPSSGACEGPITAPRSWWMQCCMLCAPETPPAHQTGAFHRASRPGTALPARFLTQTTHAPPPQA